MQFTFELLEGVAVIIKLPLCFSVIPQLVIEELFCGINLSSLIIRALAATHRFEGKNEQALDDIFGLQISKEADTLNDHVDFFLLTIALEQVISQKYHLGILDSLAIRKGFICKSLEASHRPILVFPKTSQFEEHRGRTTQEGGQVFHTNALLVVKDGFHCSDLERTISLAEVQASQARVDSLANEDSTLGKSIKTEAEREKY